MKKRLVIIILTALFTGIFPACAQNTTSPDPKAFLDKLGNPVPVQQSENMVDLSIRSVTKSGNDYIIDYNAGNSIISGNSGNRLYLMTQVFFIDPENFENIYQPFTIDDGKISVTLEAGDIIEYPVRRIKFEPPSKIMYMYFTGIEKSVSDDLYTVPLFFIIILGDNPHVYEQTPRHAGDLFDMYINEL